MPKSISPRSRTRTKLEEAQFFLAKVRRHYHDDIQDFLRGKRRRSVFPFYVSAFISAARSVTWIMRAEYSKVSGWEVWFRDQRVESEDVELLTIFNDLRVESQKIAPLVPGHIFDIADEVSASLGKKNRRRNARAQKLKITIRDAGNPSKPPLYEGPVRSVGRTLDALDGKDLLTASERYMEILRRLVDGCDKQFSPPPSGPRS